MKPDFRSRVWLVVTPGRRCFALLILRDSRGRQLNIVLMIFRSNGSRNSTGKSINDQVRNTCPKRQQLSNEIAFRNNSLACLSRPLFCVSFWPCLAETSKKKNNFDYLLVDYKEPPHPAPFCLVHHSLLMVIGTNLKHHLWPFLTCGLSLVSRVACNVSHCDHTIWFHLIIS